MNEWEIRHIGKYKPNMPLDDVAKLSTGVFCNGKCVFKSKSASKAVQWVIDHVATEVRV